MKEITVNRTIADRLREARNLGGFSQVQAARMMGMHRPTVSEIEAGNRKVSADELQRFARLYDVGVEWLLGQDAEQPLSPAGRFERAYRALRNLDPDDIEKLLKRLTDSRGNGRRIAAKLRPNAGKSRGRRRPSADCMCAAWTEEDNARRCELIDREIEGSITVDEAEELANLQQAMRSYLDKIAPVPMEGAKRLHAELLRKHRSRR